MRNRVLLAAVAVLIVGCGGSDTPEARRAARMKDAQDRMDALIASGADPRGADYNSAARAYSRALDDHAEGARRDAGRERNLVAPHS